MHMATQCQLRNADIVCIRFQLRCMTRFGRYLAMLFTVCALVFFEHASFRLLITVNSCKYVSGSIVDKSSPSSGEKYGLM